MHRCECHVFPPAEVRAKFKLFMAIAGWTCVAWSSMSHKPMKWLHSSSIVWLIWLFSTLQHLPDWIVGECVIYFDDFMLQMILNDFDYDLAVLTRNPSDDGFPCDRRRKFMVATRRATLRALIPCTEDTARALFNRQCMLDGRVYFRAPKSEVLAFLDQMAAQRFLPPGEWRMEDLLDYGQRKRFLSYRKIAQSCGKLFIIVDLNQNPAFWRRLGSTCPPLLRRSSLCGITLMSSKVQVTRPLLVCESFGVQAVPVLLPKSHFLSALLPRLLRFASFRQTRLGQGEVSMTEYKSMAGNGQHLASIGSVLVLSVMGFATCEMV